MQLAYHYTDARKTQGAAADSDPVGVPAGICAAHQASFGTDHRWRSWQLSSTLVFTSYRYINASGTDFLPGTGLLSATLGRTLRGPGATACCVLVQAANLLNQAYDRLSGPAGAAPQLRGQPAPGVALMTAALQHGFLLTANSILHLLSLLLPALDWRNIHEKTSFPRGGRSPAGRL